MIKTRTVFRTFFLLGLALVLPGQISLSGAQGMGGHNANAGMTVPRSALSGQHLMSFCNSKYDVDAGFCSGYIAAIAETMAVQQTYAQHSCGHAGVKPQQWMDTVKIEVDANPSLVQLPAGVMVAQIVAMSYPCYNDYEPAAGGDADVSAPRAIEGYTAEPLSSGSLSSPLRP